MLARARLLRCHFLSGVLVLGKWLARPRWKAGAFNLATARDAKGIICYVALNTVKIPAEVSGTVSYANDWLRGLLKK